MDKMQSRRTMLGDVAKLSAALAMRSPLAAFFAPARSAVIPSERSESRDLHPRSRHETATKERAAPARVLPRRTTRRCSAVEGATGAFRRSIA